MSDIYSEVKGYKSVDEKKGISIDELKRSIPIELVVRNYGGITPEPQTWSEWLPMSCPFHKDTNPSASINYKLQRFRCHTCDVGGDVVDLVAEHEGLTVKGAMEFLRERFL